MITQKELQKTVKYKVKGNLVEFKYLTDKKGDKELQIAQAKWFDKKLRETLDKDKKKKYKLYVNFSEMDKISLLTSEARKIYAKMTMDKQLSKGVVAGNSLILKTITNFIASAVIRKEDVKWFRDKKEALEWLNKNGK